MPRRWLLLAAGGCWQSSSVPQRGHPDCWQFGFTWEQCCNELYGKRGNPICWDAGRHNFDTCCEGQLYRPADCREYVAHFDFSTMRLWPEAWERCADGMERRPELCNSPRATPEACPSCAELSVTTLAYIRCVRQEQARGRRGEGEVEEGRISEDGHGARLAAVGGWHYPTVFAPRSGTRDFSIAAPAFDAYVGNRLVTDGTWMHHEVKLLLGLTSPGDVVVDAGANIGGFTLPLAKHVGPDGLVHAFEPFRLLFQCLNANVMLNGLSNVHTHQLGLGNQTDLVKQHQPNLNVISNPSKMHLPTHVASELLVRKDPRAAEVVKVVRLDDIDLGPRGPSMVKVDVESMELALLQGASGTLARHRPLLYVEDSEVPDDSDGRHPPTRVMKFLYDRSYLYVDLIRSGLSDATSMLFVPAERREEALRRLKAVDWDQ